MRHQKISSENQYSDDPVELESHKFQFKKKLVGLLFASTILLIGFTYATNVNLNSGQGIEFGQGRILSTACDSSISITPNQTFSNSQGQGGHFVFNSASLSGVDINSCSGKVFQLQAFGPTSSTPLKIFGDSQTVAAFTLNTSFASNGVTFSKTNVRNYIDVSLNIGRAAKTNIIVLTGVGSIDTATTSGNATISGVSANQPSVQVSAVISTVQTTDVIINLRVSSTLVGASTISFLSLDSNGIPSSSKSTTLTFTSGPSEPSVLASADAAIECSLPSGTISCANNLNLDLIQYQVSFDSPLALANSIAKLTLQSMDFATVNPTINYLNCESTWSSKNCISVKDQEVLIEYIILPEVFRPPGSGLLIAQVSGVGEIVSSSITGDASKSGSASRVDVTVNSFNSGVVKLTLRLNSAVLGTQTLYLNTLDGGGVPVFYSTKTITWASGG
jgi:hypothetical protein